MPSFYRLMLGKKNKYAEVAFAEGFAGADFGLHIDLTADIGTSQKAFISKHRAAYLKRPRKKDYEFDDANTALKSGRALGQLWTLALGVDQGDVLIAPDGAGNYRVGFVTTSYFYSPNAVLPHRRNVDWEDKLFPSSKIPSDIYRAATGFTGTICNLNKYETSFMVMLNGEEIDFSELSQNRIGKIKGVELGQEFVSREELRLARVHRPPMSGISYISNGPAESIVISGGYKDDKDDGDRIIYTGQGGQDAPGGKQIRDQEITRGNRALIYSKEHGKPIRVIRGSGGNKQFSPKSGYRYEGLFQVAQNWFEPSVDGPLVIRFELVKLEEDLLNNSDLKVLGAPPAGQDLPNRKPNTGSSIVRSSEVSNYVKRAHNNRCQFCRITLIIPSGTYSEGAHIRALGEPHKGKDIHNNMLCLCPNCHILFDRGALYIRGNGRTVVSAITGTEREMYLHEDYILDLESIAHHRLRVAGIKDA